MSKLVMWFDQLYDFPENLQVDLKQFQTDDEYRDKMTADIEKRGVTHMSQLSTVEKIAEAGVETFLLEFEEAYDCQLENWQKELLRCVYAGQNISGPSKSKRSGS